MVRSFLFLVSLTFFCSSALSNEMQNVTSVYRHTGYGDNHLEYSKRISNPDELFNKYYKQIQALRNNELMNNVTRRLEDNNVISSENNGGVRHINRIFDMVNKLKQDNRVIVTFTDFSYLEAFYVSYTVSRLWRFPNFFVVALDKRTYDVLESQNFPVALIKTNEADSVKKTTDRSDYGGHSFNQIMRMKLIIIRYILNMNVGVLIFDSDVVIFKDPFSGLPENDEFDIIAQKDEHVCAGFIYWRPTPTSRRLVTMAMRRMEGREIHDQEAILEIIENKLLPELEARLFHPPIYNRGNIFFEKHQFCWIPIDPKVVMAHNNYVVGYENKIYRLKETGLYNLDLDEEYSSLTAKYLVLESYAENQYESGLRILVRLANALNRHIVLPIFPCYVKERPETECNLCGHQPINCHKDIMRQAKLSWKEHVFFHNKYVPDIVKQDYINAPITYITATEDECNHMRGNADGNTRCLILPSMTLSDEAIQTLFSVITEERVIRLYNIPNNLKEY